MWFSHLNLNLQGIFGPAPLNEYKSLYRINHYIEGKSSHNLRFPVTRCPSLVSLWCPGWGRACAHRCPRRSNTSRMVVEPTKECGDCKGDFDKSYSNPLRGRIINHRKNTTSTLTHQLLIGIYDDAMMRHGSSTKVKLTRCSYVSVFMLGEYHWL